MPERSTIPITATAISGASKLTVPASVAFGPVAVGLSSTLTFPVTNSGNIPLVINKAKAPAGVFSSTSPLAEGLAIQPGATVYQSVTFTPTALGEAGSAATYYLITGDDGSGPHQVMLTGSGVNDPVAVVGAQYGGSYLTPLGVVAGPQYPVGSGQCQNYTSGAACWSTTTGAHAVPGSIGRQYLANGGAGGFLGFPVGDQFCGLVGGGCGQFFQGGVIYWSPPTSAHPVSGAILADWGATGWERTLGYPITDMFCGLQGGLRQHFSNGASIYWSPATGAHAVQGAIRGEYAALGWEHGLGYPTGDMFCGLGNGGCGQFFQGGAIYWSPGTGAHAVSGAILGEWGRTGWEHTLGYPTGEMFCGLVNGGCGQHFSNAASIYWSPTTGAHAVTGGIRSFWAAQGWERGTLGYPTSELYAVTGAYRQNFQRGALSWNASTGVVRKL